MGKIESSWKARSPLLSHLSGGASSDNGHTCAKRLNSVNSLGVFSRLSTGSEELLVNAALCFSDKQIAGHASKPSLVA